jgi:predicted aldo/keto reductase-like oxidoreductase
MSETDSRLPRRRLGKTNLQPTVIGFGGIPIQLASHEEAVATVRRAYELGVNFFDTARGYTTSEERIGEALEHRDCIIATKSGAREAEAIYEDVKQSLGKLRRAQIDLYQFHGINDDEQLERVLAPGGALEGLRRARDEGKIAHIGITGHRRETLMKALADAHELETVQVPFNVVEDEALDSLLPLCAERDVGAIAMKPVGGGNFTYAPLAVKWCINQPISVAIPGIANVQEAEEDAAVGLGGIELTAEDRAELSRMKQELDQRTCRRCRYCEPCPNGVQIGMLLHGRTIIRRMGVARFLDFGAKQVVASAAQCTECGECLPKCPYQLPIPELIREAVAHYQTFPELKEG